MDVQPGIRFKCSLGQDTRNIYLDSPVEFDHLNVKIAQYFRSRVSILGVDRKGGRRPLRNQSELSHFLADTKLNNPNTAVKLVLSHLPFSSSGMHDGFFRTHNPSQRHSRPTSYMSDSSHFENSYQSGTYQRAHIQKEPSRRRNNLERSHTSEQSLIAELFPQLSMHDSVFATEHVSSSLQNRPSSPPPGYLESDQSIAPFREVSGGGEFIPETEDIQSEKQWTGQLNDTIQNLRRIQSSHSLASSHGVYSGYGSQRSGLSYSTDSASLHPGTMRVPLKHVFPDDAESGVFERESQSGVAPLDNNFAQHGERHRSGTYPRIGSGVGHSMRAYGGPYTLPRERTISPSSPVPSAHVDNDANVQRPTRKSSSAIDDGSISSHVSSGSGTNNRRAASFGNDGLLHNMPMPHNLHPSNDTGSDVPRMPHRWQIGELLGSGAFGKVYKALDQDTGAEIAVKQVDLDVGGDSSSNSSAVEALEIEIQLLRSLNHPRIVRYLGTARTHQQLSIVMEYVPGRSIARRLREYGAFSVDVVRKYTRQILEGLYYLHSHQIIHRDVKGANVLANAAGNIKLADFGAARQLQTIRTMTGFRSIHGTPYWMAPEVIQGRGYGRRSDIWSLACTVIEMLSGNPPYHYCEPMAVLFKIGSSNEDFSETIPEDLPLDGRMFLEACFQRNPEQRPSSEELLEFAFIQ